MKKFFALVAVVCAAVMFVPCDAFAGPAGKKVKKDKVEKYAEKDPVRRAFGTGEHFNESSARNIAEMNARATFGQKIEAATYRAIESSTLLKSQLVSNNNSSATLTEGTVDTKEMTSTISSQIIRNTHVVKTSVYYQENKTYKVNVCIEFMGTPDQMFTGFAEVLERHLDRQDKATVEVHLEEARRVFTATMEQ